MKIDNIAFQPGVGGSWIVPLTMTKHHILLLVVKGVAIYRFGDRTVRVGKGEALFFPQGSTRSAESDLKDPSQMYSAHFRDISPEDLPASHQEPYIHFRPLGYEYLKQRFSLLNECWLGKMPSYELISRGILFEILGIVQRELSGGAHSSSRRSLALRIQQYIVQRYREPLRLSELAQAVDRSPTYVSTVFKEVTGRTPVEYMHEVRISAARELLLTNSMTIGEISESLGYCDPTYFNHMYKKIVGHPPSHTLKLQHLT
ncbi:helix-turn-helix domain-containing protein [Paenibacillus hemerocallicola]|uniref:Helix-turn-helix domain-containing protein n=1 Tax=Paenibacillus hemerocallicola TaxID=1172614 RepID=A0A5C4T611_9BACL|nr:AraC family transcriptional regulator [Paenibacillus hemerocallicola]TNJ64225.1 helix-turn-helix domain-containing protein [Paenibacillus hemerocallicola]